jgi:5-methyltetrahydrofolate--homocysteine methyltransferase
VITQKLTERKTVEILSRIKDALQNGDHTGVADLCRRAIDSGAGAAEIIDRGLLAGMDVIGRRFGAHEIFLPQVLLAARAMKAGMDVVKPLLVAGETPSRGKIVLGTVAGDVHDIGKNLVAIMLEGAGFEVIDLGTGVEAARFVDTAVAERARIIGLSALLTTTMPAMRDVTALVTQRGLDDRLKIIVGGAPLSQAYADEIGAAGYSYDAAGAVELVKRLTDID